MWCKQFDPAYIPSQFCDVRRQKWESFLFAVAFSGTGGLCAAPGVTWGGWFEAPRIHEPHAILSIVWLPNLDLL